MFHYISYYNHSSTLKCYVMQWMVGTGEVSNFPEKTLLRCTSRYEGEGVNFSGGKL